MKKLVLLLLLTTLLTSCTTQMLPPTATEPTPKLTAFLPPLSYVTSAFENCEITTAESDYLKVLKIKLQSENPPTVFYLPTTADIPEFLPYLENLSTEKWVSELYSIVLGEVSVDGNVYAMPVEIAGMGIVYNSEVFSIASINPNNLTSRKILEKSMQILATRIENGNFSATHPNLKKLYSENPLDVAENHAALTVAFSNEFPETATHLSIIPLCINEELNDKLLLKINGVLCVNKNASESQKNLAKSTLNSLYGKIAKSTPLSNSVNTICSGGKSKIFSEEEFELYIKKEISEIFAKKQSKTVDFHNIEATFSTFCTNEKFFKKSIAKI